MQVELIDFKTEDGVVLNGFISNVNSKKILIATNGMTSNCFKGRERIIAEKCLQNDIAFLGYNNRGSELAKYIKKIINGKEEKTIGGTAYENVLEGYFDIVAAINKALELGYEEIYLQGHSLGSTKTVYTYKKLLQENSKILKNIKALILLSLVDLPRMVRVYNKEMYDEYLAYAEMKEKEGNENELMPKEAFFHPMSVKSYLIYAKNNSEFDFAKYKEDTKFEVLNSIKIPIFIRWGNVNELIEQSADELTKKMNIVINNNYMDINFIDGADHGYSGKEELLATQIINFIKNIQR